MTSPKETSETFPKKEEDLISEKQRTAKFVLEGYAFQDNIIGIVFRHDDGLEAPDLKLRQMIYREQLESSGFSAYVSLGDKTSGEADEPLLTKYGSHQYMFLSIRVHEFDSTTEAHSAVLDQCRKLLAVSYAVPVCYFLHNIFCPYICFHPLSLVDCI